LWGSVDYNELLLIPGLFQILYASFDQWKIGFLYCFLTLSELFNFSLNFFKILEFSYLYFTALLAINCKSKVSETSLESLIDCLINIIQSFIISISFWFLISQFHTLMKDPSMGLF
jgi:hypothetical protein